MPTTTQSPRARRGVHRCLKRPLLLAGTAVCVALLAIGLASIGPLTPAVAQTAPTPTIFTATDLSSTAATLNASVDPGGTATVLTFCYSTSTITISGNLCTSSSLVGYATATDSPLAANASTVFSAYVTDLSPGTTYYFAAGASQSAGSTSWSTDESFTTMTGAPFVCSPNFYEEAESILWYYNPITNKYTDVNPSADQSVDLNPIGYDTLNNYIYGVNGTDLYQVGADGNEALVGSPEYAADTSGDFIPGTNFFVTENGGGGPFDMIDVTSPSAATSDVPASTVLEPTSGSATFYGNDFSFAYVTSPQPEYVAYGLRMSGSTAVLSKLVIPASVIDDNDNSADWGPEIANAMTVTQVSGITFPSGYQPGSSDAFGSTYSDSSGDVFFLANSAQVLYEATAAQLATGSSFQLSYAASAALSGGTYDGADCEASSSPFAPPTPEDATYTVVAGHTLTVDTASASLFANDQILSGATVTMGTTTLEPTGADTATTFSTGDTSGVLTGNAGSLDVTDAANGYFTFTPDTGFNGPETFTYNLSETYPYNLTSTTDATVTVNVVQQQVVNWSTPTDLTTQNLYTTPQLATDLGNAPITYSVDITQPNTAGCSVNPTSGTITYMQAGACSIVASAAATANYSAASTELTFNVTDLPIPTLTWSPSPTTLTTSGTTVTGTPTTNSDGTVSYSVASTGNTAGCSLASSSAPVVISYTSAPGQCSVTVTTSQTSDFASQSVTVPFTVLATPSFSWAPTPTAFTLGQSPEDIAPVTTDSDGVVTYSVSSTGNSAGCSLASASAPVVLSFSSNGSCTVDANLAQSTSYSGASTSQLFTVGPVMSDQAIAFTTTNPGPVQVGSTYTPAATGGGSGNPVVFSIDLSSSSVCSISSETVTFDTAGTCVIDANQAGSTDYYPAPQAQQMVAVDLLPQQVTFSSLTPTEATVGEIYAPEATGGGSGNPVVFSIGPSSASVCSINSATVSFSAVGTCLVDANQAGNSAYAAAQEATQSIAVGPAAPTTTAPTTTTTAAPPAPTTTTTAGAALAFPPASPAGSSSTASASPSTVPSVPPGPAPQLRVQVVGEPASVLPGTSFELMVAPSLGTAGGQAGRGLGFKLTVPSGEIVTAPPVSTGWSCATSDGGHQLVCAWDGGTMAAGTALPKVPVPVKVSAEPKADQGVVVTFFDSLDDALPASTEATSSVALGYRLAGADGGVFDFGGAHFLRSCHSRAEACQHLENIVSMASAPGGHGYWLAAKDGGVFAFGQAGYHGSCPDVTHPCGKPVSSVVSIAATPDGQGYWLATSTGHVYAFGDAHNFGSCSRDCTGIVSMAALPDGQGYWLTGADGKVHAFGEAQLYKPAGTSPSRLRGAVVGIAPTRDGKGYWLAASDGGVFAYGDAHFLGNTYTAHVEAGLREPIVGIASDPAATGYWLVAKDGGVFAFHQSHFLGNTYTASVEGRLVGPVVAISAEG